MMCSRKERRSAPLPLVLMIGLVVLQIGACTTAIEQHSRDSPSNEAGLEKQAVITPAQAKDALVQLVESFPRDSLSGMTLPNLKEERPRHLGGEEYRMGPWDVDLARSRFSIVIDTGLAVEVREGTFVRDTSGAWKAVVTRTLYSSAPPLP